MVCMVCSRTFFFSKCMPSRQQRAVKSQIFILQVTSTIITYFLVSIDVKTFQVLKNITKPTMNEQGQDRTTIKVGEFIGFGDVYDRGWKQFFASNKKKKTAYLHISFLLTQSSDCGLYEQIGDHSSYVFI